MIFKKSITYLATKPTPTTFTDENDLFKRKSISLTSPIDSTTILSTSQDTVSLLPYYEIVLRPANITSLYKSDANNFVVSDERNYNTSNTILDFLLAIWHT